MPLRSGVDTWSMTPEAAPQRRIRPADAVLRQVSRPGGGTGRRKGLKIPRPQGHAGSIPAPGTNKIKGLGVYPPSHYPLNPFRGPLVGHSPEDGPRSWPLCRDSISAVPTNGHSWVGRLTAGVAIGCCGRGRRSWQIPAAVFADDRFRLHTLSAERAFLHAAAKSRFPALKKGCKNSGLRRLRTSKGADFSEQR